VYLLLLVFWRD